MEESKSIIDVISNLLESGKYKEALSLPKEDKNESFFRDNCSDLISVVVSKIQDDTALIKPSLHSTCEELLFLITQKATPEEALLEFIEQIEIAKNDAQFGIILMPLQALLKKLLNKRGRSLEWCLNSITTYVETIPIPEHCLEGKERLLMDSDLNVRRIIKVYSMLPLFYGPFIKELNKMDTNFKTKQIITAFLISLLGRPLIYIDLDPDTNASSEARYCCEVIIQDINELEKDFLKFLKYVESCNRGERKLKLNDDDSELLPYENRDKINMSTLSGLFYAMFSGHFKVPDTSLPQVYSTEYLFHTIMLCVVHLYGHTEYGPLAKGHALCKALLNRLPVNASHTLLSHPVHFDLYKCLVNIAIFSTYESIRKDAVFLIGSHVNKFEFRGRCKLIRYLLDVANHSGMIGYAITLYKNSIDEAFKNSELPDCFTGAQLTNMLKKICYLPHGATSDLVELADQIITALNFLRYLALKDTNNSTGIKDYFSTIETEYLEVLRTGLNMSKAHYEVKLKDLTEGKNTAEEIVSLTVAGSSLDNIPTENKKEIINSALNAFYLMEGLVARLSECIKLKKNA